MTFHCTKLCSGECCVWLRLWLDVANTKPALAIANECGCRSCAAMNVAIDPAKVAALYVLALLTRGVDGHTIATRVNNGITVRTRSGVVADLTIQEARTKLLAIMQTTPDESSREACEQIVRGEA